MINKEFSTKTTFQPHIRPGVVGEVIKPLLQNGALSFNWYPTKVSASRIDALTTVMTVTALDQNTFLKTLVELVQYYAANPLTTANSQRLKDYNCVYGSPFGSSTGIISASQLRLACEMSRVFIRWYRYLDKYVDEISESLVASWDSQADKPWQCNFIPVGKGWQRLPAESTSFPFPVLKMECSQAAIDLLRLSDTAGKLVVLRNLILNCINDITNQQAAPTSIRFTNNEVVGKTPLVEITVQNHLAYLWLVLFSQQKKITFCKNPKCQKILFTGNNYCGKKCIDAHKNGTDTGLLTTLLTNWRKRHPGIPIAEWEPGAVSALNNKVAYEVVKEQLQALKKEWLATQPKKKIKAPTQEA